MSQLASVSRLGCRPRRLCMPPRVKFGDVVDLSKIEVPQGDFGQEKLLSVIPDLGNDTLSDCVIAGGSTEELVWTREDGHPCVMNRATAISNYEYFGGYDPNAQLVDGQNPTDDGCDMVAVAEGRITRGMEDANNVFHRLGAYVALEPGNVDQLWAAMYLFDGVGIGLLFPDEWMQACETGAVWDYVNNPNVNQDDGHYVTGFGRTSGNIVVASFAMWCQMTPAGYGEFSDQTVAYLTQERLRNGKDSEGFSYSQLRNYFGQLPNM